jgi:hypothetical protein
MHQGRESITLQQRSGGGADALAEQCLVEKDKRYDGYISLKPLRTDSEISLENMIACSEDLPMV